MTPTLTGLILIGVIVIITLYYAWLNKSYINHQYKCKLKKAPKNPLGTYKL